jgi:hypothetical protein
MESSKYTGQLIANPIPVRLQSCCCRYATVTRGKQLILHNNSHIFFYSKFGLNVAVPLVSKYCLIVPFRCAVDVRSEQSRSYGSIGRSVSKCPLRISEREHGCSFVILICCVRVELVQGYFRVKRNSEVCHAICNYHFLLQPVPKLRFSS